LLERLAQLRQVNRVPGIAVLGDLVQVGAVLHVQRFDPAELVGVDGKAALGAGSGVPQHGRAGIGGVAHAGSGGLGGDGGELFSGATKLNLLFALPLLALFFRRHGASPPLPVIRVAGARLGPRHGRRSTKAPARFRKGTEALRLGS